MSSGFACSTRPTGFGSFLEENKGKLKLKGERKATE
jgi:hypothetical protein